MGREIDNSLDTNDNKYKKKIQSCNYSPKYAKKGRKQNCIIPNIKKT